MCRAEWASWLWLAPACAPSQRLGPAVRAYDLVSGNAVHQLHRCEWDMVCGCGAEVLTDSPTSWISSRAEDICVLGRVRSTQSPTSPSIWQLLMYDIMWQTARSLRTTMTASQRRTMSSRTGHQTAASSLRRSLNFQYAATHNMPLSTELVATAWLCAAPMLCLPAVAPARRPSRCRSSHIK